MALFQEVHLKESSLCEKINTLDGSCCIRGKGARRSGPACGATPAHPSLIQPSPASPMIDFQNSVGNPSQTQLLRHGNGSDALNDVNYLATNDSNTPERSPEQSDTSLPCRFKPFKCKSTCDSPRRHNSCLSSKCTSNW